jgi:hypothetical protein
VAQRRGDVLSPERGRHPWSREARPHLKGGPRRRTSRQRGKLHADSAPTRASGRRRSSDAVRADECVRGKPLVGADRGRSSAWSPTRSRGNRWRDDESSRPGINPGTRFSPKPGRTPRRAEPRRYACSVSARAWDRRLAGGRHRARNWAKPEAAGICWVVGVEQTTAWRCICTLWKTTPAESPVRDCRFPSQTRRLADAASSTAGCRPDR